MKWWLVGLWALLPKAVEACAGCSNPNLPVTRNQQVGLHAGDFALGLTLTGTTMNVKHPSFCPEIGPICRIQAEPGQVHDQTFYSGEVRITGEVAATDNFGLELQVPVRVVRTTIVYRRLSGEEFDPG